MLCVILHIRKDAKDHLNIDHIKQVNNGIKTLFHGLSDDEIYFTLNLFWTEYTGFDNNNGLFGGD